VIVVDSSADETPRIVEREFPTVRLIHLGTKTFAGAARNIGIRASRVPFCLMIDSDCIAQCDLIERMIARHREARYAAVGGSLRNGTPNSVSGWIGYLLEFKEYTPEAPRRFVTTLPTANVMYRREALERYGLFDEDIWLGEDMLFNWKLTSSGEQILFDPKIEVTHLNRTGWREVLSYQISLGSTQVTARRRGNGLGLPSGETVLRYPVLIALMPIVRLLRAAIWLAANDRKALLLFMFVWPMYFLGAAFWSFGFLQGVMNED
jgi:GT2 family glycosyltransferase